MSKAGTRKPAPKSGTSSDEVKAPTTKKSQPKAKAVSPAATFPFAAVLTALVLAGVFALALGSDGTHWLIWLLGLLAPAAAVWPLAVRLFRAVPAVALPFALALGVLLLSFPVWTLSYLHVLPFRSWAVWLVLALVAAACWVPARLRSGTREYWRDRNASGGFGFFVVLFVVALAAWTWMRGLNPKIDGLEKFMDYGFMMSITRTDYLPAADMWLAGSDINYYYYGQFVYTLLGELSFTPPPFAYNLGLATTFAFIVALAGAIGWQLNALRTKPADAAHSTRRNIAAALLTSFLVAIAGNAHAFFYAPGAPGGFIVKALGLGSTDAWFYPHSTRFIGHNPITDDKTIHEFPYYSFLVGDLHAHLANTVFVLLFVGLLVQYVVARREVNNSDAATGGLGSGLRTAYLGVIRQPMLLIAALLLSVFTVANYWDLAIYFVVLVVVAIVMAYSDRTAGATRPALASAGVLLLQVVCALAPFVLISEPALAAAVLVAGSLISALLMLTVRTDALTRSGFQIVTVFALAYVLSLPFRLSFDPISQKIALATNHTPLWQLLVLWGPQLLILLGALVAFVSSRPIANERPRADWLVLALGICAVGLIAGPEIVYLVDIYENGFARANTMFKLTYQASILLGIVVAYIAMGAWERLSRVRREHESSALAITGFVAVVLLLIPLAWYPFAATPQVQPNLGPSAYVGLDGEAWMRDAQPGTAFVSDVEYPENMADDYAAIAWLNTEVAGQPVIIEATGISYTHLNRVSAYTGLPTPLGWQTHEWLWRTTETRPDAYGTLIVPLQEEVQNFYTDPATYGAATIDKYGIEYVVLGQWEINRYPEVDQAGVEALGEVVFQSGEMRIIRVKP